MSSHVPRRLAPLAALALLAASCAEAERPRAEPERPRAEPVPVAEPSPPEPAPPPAEAEPAGPTCVLDPAPSPGGGWPRGDAEALVAHLNGWDREELDVFERPEAYPDRVGSGETAGWVTEHKRQLTELGAEAVWIPENKCYGIRRTR